VEYSSNLSAIYTKSCAQAFPPIFRLFEMFCRHFDKNENYVLHLNDQCLPKKALKTASKSANKRQRNACSNYAPLEVSRTYSAPASERDKELTTRNKSITSNAMQYQQDISTRTPINYAGGVNNYLNSNHAKYLAQLCGRCFCVLENFCRKFANLVAPPSNRLRNL